MKRRPKMVSPHPRKRTKVLQSMKASKNPKQTKHLLLQPKHLQCNAGEKFPPCRRLGPRFHVPARALLKRLLLKL